MRYCRRLHWTNIFVTFFLLIPILIFILAIPPVMADAPIDSKVLEQIDKDGKTSFWVVMRDQADLSQAYQIKDWKERGQFVYDKLKSTATQTQASLNAVMSADSIQFNSFWAINAIKVTGDKALVEKLAARAEVGEIRAESIFEIPPPIAGRIQPYPAKIEWNIERINAPKVWEGFNTRGEGIVVANIDTGVQFDHPALVEQYRGNMGDGKFDHNYNWYDPEGYCKDPLTPCDDYGHGTHTMGTMVGDDGKDKQIGVAPGAKWIAVKGCDMWGGCPDEALLSSGQWILAPTDLNGENPRPDLRPHAVNNSWGSWFGCYDWYMKTVDAWRASGIFPAFSIGNSGPECGTAGSPGDYPQSYASGAFDINDNIAWFSSRGPACDVFNNETKPNIAAPGVDVLSSVPGDWYESWGGTSMASPHTAGTVALMWSAAPSLVGNIELTSELLDITAVDIFDYQCEDGNQPFPPLPPFVAGPEDNNVWGEGILDAYAAVDASPKGPTGTLQGTVTDSVNEIPLMSALIHVVGEETDRTTYTDFTGSYSISYLPVGIYDVSASLFGYLPETVSGIVVSEGAITTQDFELVQAPSHSVSGHVTDDADNPIPNAKVTILDTPIKSALTDEDGFYSFPSVPEGTYQIRAEAGRCSDPETLEIVVDADLTVDFILIAREDAFGYRCEIIPLDWIDADKELPLYGLDVAIAVDLPFPFMLYGKEYDIAYVCGHGFLNFLGYEIRWWNGPIPEQAWPNAAIYAFWDDLYIDQYSGDRVKVRTLGEAPDRIWVLEYENLHFTYDWSHRVNFEMKLYERNGWIEFHYLDMPGPGDGSQATIGIENEEGIIGFQYSFNEPVISDGFAVRFIPPPTAIVEGTVTDAIDGNPIAAASVRVLKDGEQVRQVATDENGFYRMLLRLGTYTIEASKPYYATETAEVVLDEVDEIVVQDFALRSARAEISPTSLEFILPPGMTRISVLNLSNVGLADLTFQIGEMPTLATNSIPGPPGSNSHNQPDAYAPIPVQSILAGGPVLVFLDYLPWGSDALLQVLNANGIPFDVANSSQMSTINMAPYEVVCISNDQPQLFYDEYRANVGRFEEYVMGGGFLWFGAADWGWNGGDLNGAPLPGGPTVLSMVFEEMNDVMDAAHPIMEGVPNPFFGTGASHSAFENLTPDTHIIARGTYSLLPNLIEYSFGAGKVLAFGQTLEYGYMNGQDAGIILKNAVPYAYGWEPILDVPWISTDPTSGTVPPGADQQILVTIDSTGLETGIYKADLVFLTNDPRNQRLTMQVTLIVPAYLQRVDAGSKKKEPYVDTSGDVWAFDQEWEPGGWGYVDRSQSRFTKEEISGTDDDPIYQDLRMNMLEYRFDGLPAGTYQVGLRFAEISPVPPNIRLYHVYIEGVMMIEYHDTALEVGIYAADDHTFYLDVTDGQLNIRFLPIRGYQRPIINGIEVIHRPDMMNND